MGARPFFCRRKAAKRVQRARGRSPRRGTPLPCEISPFQPIELIEIGRPDGYNRERSDKRNQGLSEGAKCRCKER